MIPSWLVALFCAIPAVLLAVLVYLQHRLISQLSKLLAARSMADYAAAEARVASLKPGFRKGPDTDVGYSNAS